MLGLLHCVCGNIQIHEWLRIAHTVNRVQASGVKTTGKIHDSKCEIVHNRGLVIRKTWSHSCKLIVALLCFDVLGAIIWPDLIDLRALDGPSHSMTVTVEREALRRVQ